MGQEKPQRDEDEEEVKNQLRSILHEEVVSGSINEQDMLILFLRLGLHGDRPYTLAETGQALYILAERVRQRQYFLLHRKIKNPQFFQLLKIYARYRRLPPGLELHDPLEKGIPNN